MTRFLADRKARNLSSASITFYTGYLNSFVKHIRKPILDVTREDIAQFVASLACSPGGKHAYYRAIRAFFKWAYEEDFIAASPTDKMKAPKVPKPLRQTVGLNDLDTLLATWDNVRDKLIISMAADTGLRRAELASINAADIDLERQIIRVWGKCAKQRLVRYGPCTRSLLVEWLRERPEGHRRTRG